MNETRDESNQENIPSLAPSHPLTLMNATPPAGEKPPPTRFILFSREWLVLQNYIQQALKLPINQGNWDEKYGAFSEKRLVTNTLDAMGRVRSLAEDFGSPATLKRKVSEDPDYMLEAEPPAEIYGHIVWLATQISNAAGTFHHTLDNLVPILSLGDENQRANNLKSILIGQGGLVSTAEVMRKKTGALLQKLAAFDGKISEANEQIMEYAGKGSLILEETGRLIGHYKDDIENNLKPAADAAYKAWRDYTIAAVTTSVGITVLSFGLLAPVGLGLGIGLGVAAAKQMDKYNALMDEIKKERAEIAKKTRLQTDLSGLNDSVGLVAPALNKFKTSLSTIEGVWVDIGSDLAYIASNYTVDQLGNLPWINQALRISDANNKWKGIGETTQEFTQHSLVSYDLSVSWGQKLPQAA